jgi:hypothetical protein
MTKNRDIHLEEEKPHTETQYMREKPVRESKKREKKTKQEEQLAERLWE